jgi:dynein heavy chain
MESEALQWRKWYADAAAESCELPRAHKDISLFYRMLLLRAMRPDRLSNALTQFVTEVMGERYVEQPAFNFFNDYKESTKETPIFFVLFPGEDPTPIVERVGASCGKTAGDRTFTNISMGQGQEKVAEDCLVDSAKNGKWIMLQNVHLMIDWMRGFERKLEVAVAEDCHEDFRCYITSEPPPLDDQDIIPEAILQNSIKIANEAPQNLKANLRRAFSKFEQSEFDKAKEHKEKEYKALLFGLCMFHSLILGRKKFGAQGWSRNYNFNDGDLTISGQVIHNYLSRYEKVPYADLRYIFGDIMYGGHITDDWDRRCNSTYLLKLIKPEILQQMQLTMTAGFKSPIPEKFDRERYEEYIEKSLPAEIPQMFGLHPNAEIGYLTNQANSLFNYI